ncbi:carboxypeptidase regulatory-like domain-containing protein [Myroides sp. LJL115]
MKTQYIKILLVVLSLVFISISCSEDYQDEFGEGTIEGTVVSHDDLKPLANIKIETSPLTNTVFTDEDGKFILTNVKQGDYSVKGQGKGYVTIFEPTKVYSGRKSNVVLEMEYQKEEQTPPIVPVLKTPKNNELLTSTSANFSWSSEPDIVGEVNYTLTLHNANTDKVIYLEGIKDSVYTYDELELGAKYFWQVTVDNSLHEPVKSEMGSFSVFTAPLENRILFTRKVAENNVLFSTNDKAEDFALTSSNINSYRPRRNYEANKIAFLQNNGASTDIYTINRDGSNLTKVTTDVKPMGFNMNELGICWPSQSDKIYFSNFDKLYRISSNGQGLELIYQTKDGAFISEMDVNHTHSIIALKTNDSNGYQASIYAVDFNGNLLFSVLDKVDGAVSGLHLSSNGQKLVYSHDISGEQNSEYRRFDSKIFIYDRKTNASSSVSGNKPNGTIDIDPRFSPNEAYIIFTNTSNDGKSSANLYSMDINSKDRKLVQSNAKMPDWL